MNTHIWNINPSDLLRISGKVWVYWKNCEGNYLGCNDLMAEDLGLSSRKDIEGRTDYDFNLPTMEATLYRDIDKQVMHTRITKQLRDTATLHHAKLNFIVLKTAIIDSQNKVAGVVGFSHYANKENLEFMNLSTLNIDGVSFKGRSAQVIQLLIRGNTIKQIAQLLGLSPRTIETHVNNIKNKLKVSSKSELIEKIFDRFI